MTIFQRLVLKSLLFLLEYLVLRKEGYKDGELRQFLKEIEKELAK